MNASTKYELFRAYFERSLEEVCFNMKFRPAVLAESMKYSLLAGGKRIRPVLFLGTLEALGCDYTEQFPLALAIECIHTYSLIHDDLPAMDNDDLRRGKPSNHKVFGEGNAILAGDGLLSYAFDLLLLEAAKGERSLAAARILSSAAGVEGMVAGQSADLASAEGAGEDELLFIHRNKTAKMIAAPLSMAAAVAGSSLPLGAFGEKLGLLFQLTDDLLDAAAGEDAGLTAVKVYGTRRAEALADALASECQTMLGAMPMDTELLNYIVSLVRERKH